MDSPCTTKVRLHLDLDPPCATKVRKLTEKSPREVPGGHLESTWRAVQAHLESILPSEGTLEPSWTPQEGHLELTWRAFGGTWSSMEVNLEVIGAQFGVQDAPGVEFVRFSQF